MNGEALGDVGPEVAEPPEQLGGNGRLGGAVSGGVRIGGLRSWRLEALVALASVPAKVASVGSAGVSAALSASLGLDEDPLQLLLVVAQCRLGILAADVPTTDKGSV